MKTTLINFAVLTLLAFLMQVPQAFTVNQTVRNAREGSGSITWYVAASGSDSSDCSGPTTPCGSINGAIAKAGSGDVIKITAETYTGSSDYIVLVNKSVTLSGGWNNGFTAQTGWTTIDGQRRWRAIKVYGYSSVIIENFIVTRGLNKSITDGSGLTLIGSDLTLRNSSFYDNQSDFATIYALYAGTLTIQDSSIGLNEGSGISAEFPILISLNNVTIARNSSTYSTGGIRVYAVASNEAVVMNNTIIAENTGSAASPDCSFSSANIHDSDHNIIKNSAGCTFSSGTNNQFGIDPLLGPLSPEGVFLLKSGSPAIDAGSPAIPGSAGGACEATDQFGSSRPVDGNNDSVARCDIGAYETPYPIVIPPAVLSSIEAYGGTPQTVVTNWLTNNFIALVRDQYHVGISGVDVTFTAPASGPSGVFSGSGTFVSISTTDSNGKATSPNFQTNGIPGSFFVDASVGGLPDSVEFQINNTDPYVYVKPADQGGNDSADCATPSTACATLSRAMEKVIPGGTIKVSSGSYSSTGTGTTPLVTINKNITISGSWNSDFNSQGLPTILDGQNQRPLVRVSDSTVASLDNLIIEHGSNTADGTAMSLGANGTLTLTNCIVRENRHSYAYNSSAAIYGAQTSDTITLNNTKVVDNFDNGVANPGSVHLNSSTVSRNQGTGVISGAVYAYNSTVSSNQNTGIEASALDSKNSTISNNSTSLNRGGGIANVGNVFTLQNTIVAGNHSPIAPDCSGTIATAGNNLIGDTTGCTFTPLASDLVNLNPKLSPYLDSFGFHAIASDSPAVDAGNDCLAVDQRGVPRPVGSACDIGSIEYQTPESPAFISPGGWMGRQTSLVNRSLTEPIQAVVVDSQGNPISGVAVDFDAPDSGAGGKFLGTNDIHDSQLTDTSGTATTSSFTTNLVCNTYSVFAHTLNVAGSAEFPLQNLCAVYLPLIRNQRPPLPFFKSTPGNSSTEVSYQDYMVTFSWNSSIYADSYEICISQTNNNRCDGNWISTGTNTFISPPGLLRDTTYYWQVRAKNADGYTEADGGVWWHFTTHRLPAAGFWSNTAGNLFFYVTPDKSYVREFAVYLNFPDCGTYWIYRTIPYGDAYIDWSSYYNEFEWGFSGMFNAHGGFPNLTTAHGWFSLNSFGPLCGYYWSTNGSIPWDAYWVNDSQPTSGPQAQGLSMGIEPITAIKVERGNTYPVIVQKIK